jgi:predicted nuclease of predicted toxin-antitoxin system
MKLLLDENLPHKLRAELPGGHDVFTVAHLGWSGLENGALLAKAAAAGFDALVTNDRGMAHEQNQMALPLSVVVLLACTNTIEAIRPLYPALDGALKSLGPRTLVTVREP